MRQIVLCSSARSITATTVPSFLRRGATTLLADPLLDVRSPMKAGDSRDLAYCISDQLGVITPPISPTPAPASSMSTGQAKQTRKTKHFRILPQGPPVRHFQKITTGSLADKQPKQQLTSAQHAVNTQKFNQPAILLVRTVGHFYSA